MIKYSISGLECFSVLRHGLVFRVELKQARRFDFLKPFDHLFILFVNLQYLLLPPVQISWNNWRTVAVTGRLLIKGGGEGRVGVIWTVYFATCANHPFVPTSSTFQNLRSIRHGVNNNRTLVRLRRILLITLENFEGLVGKSRKYKFRSLMLRIRPPLLRLASDVFRLSHRWDFMQDGVVVFLQEPCQFVFFVAQHNCWLSTSSCIHNWYLY